MGQWVLVHHPRFYRVLANGHPGATPPPLLGRVGCHKVNTVGNGLENEIL